MEGRLGHTASYKKRFHRTAKNKILKTTTTTPDDHSKKVHTTAQRENNY